ncbi:MAG: NmrA/HSCARG family protein [Actinomycetota bacterium]|nr:NmrA/HSCARG family protein [Rubrobacteraceae bacterium]MBA3637044.1 NmrA/HSCARG family protein [Rubrobacteraceae bacterium]MDQ3182249.1 NmrA/HSCARG family protein [Actinomycetota bacterium]
MEVGDNGGRVILVSGATGQQGGAVARSLLERGFAVRGLTRDVEKDEARELAGLGAEVVNGDLEDRSSIERVLEGVHGVFSVQQFMEVGVEGEVRQGVQLADAAKEAGVEHYVYTSVGSAHRDTGIPHFDSKYEVEEHVRASGVPYTVLRPVFFMQNWEYMREPILGGTLPQPLDPDKPFQMVAVEDIGVFAAMAFENPEGWIGREVDLAGDELTMPEIADTFSRVIGRQVDYFQTPWDQFEEQMGEEYTVMYRWFDEHGYEADIAGLRKEHPGLISFEQYLSTHGWENSGSPSEG